MLLKPGTSCDEAIRFLDQLMWNRLNAIETAIPRVLDERGTGMPEAIALYDEWTASTAAEMRVYFADRAVLDRLRGERYGYIVSGDPASPRTTQLLRSEINELRTYFTDVDLELRGRKERFARHAARTVVLDTNDLLHYSRFDNIPWAKVYGKDVCVVVPHVVVDEIDAKCFAESVTIRRRAWGVYHLLDQTLMSSRSFTSCGV